MSWDTDVIQSVRYIIGDVDSPVKYSDERIKTAAIISSNFINREIELLKDYEIDISLLTINPDPSSEPKDLAFLNLISLKTSILILQGELKLYASSSMRVADGPSSIDIAGIFNNTKKLIDDLVLNFNTLKNKYIMNGPSYGGVVLSITTDKNLSIDWYKNDRCN